MFCTSLGNRDLVTFHTLIWGRDYSGSDKRLKELKANIQANDLKLRERGKGG